MKIVIIIPARYKSSRLLAKPLMEIQKGEPVIKMVYERAKKFKKATTYLATDDKRIADLGESFGAKSIMTSEKIRTGTDRVYEAAKKLKLQKNDIIINVQGDQPLLNPKALDEVIKPLLEDKNIYMTTLAFKIIEEREITDSKDIKLVLDNNNFALYFSRSTIPFCRDNDIKFSYYKHLGIYAYKMHFLETFTKLKESKLEKIEKLEMLRVLENGYKIKVVVSKYDSPEVDLPEDIERIRQKLNG